MSFPVILISNLLPFCLSFSSLSTGEKAKLTASFFFLKKKQKQKLFSFYYRQHRDARDSTRNANPKLLQPLVSVQSPALSSSGHRHFSLEVQFSFLCPSTEVHFPFQWFSRFVMIAKCLVAENIVRNGKKISSSNCLVWLSKWNMRCVDLLAKRNFLSALMGLWKRKKSCQAFPFAPNDWLLRKRGENN